MADPVDEAADELYGLPFDEFIAERNTRAKALREEGEKEAAAEVAKLPKPSQVAWVANQLAREGVDDLLEAGAALREAQLGGGGREALREATAAERRAVEDLLKRGSELRPLSRDATDRLRTLLHAVAGDEQLRELFESGRLVAEPEPGGAWPEGAFVAAPRQPRPAKKDKPKESAAERRKRETAERKAAERAQKEAQRAREEAERRKLERRLRTARDAAEQAKRRLEAAQEAYEDATHEVARIEEQLS